MGTDKRERQKAGRQARIEAARIAQEKADQRAKVIRLVAIGVLVAGSVTAFGLWRRGDDATDTGAEPTTSEPNSSTPGASTPNTSTPAAPPGETITGDTPCPPAEGAEKRVSKFEKEPPTCIDPAKTYTAKVSTTAGDMTFTLDAKAAPKTVNNFVTLARYKYFDGVSFHRIIPGFVIQGGDPDANGRGDPGYKFADELPPTADVYQPGTLAMANSGANTNGSQFFIVLEAGKLQEPSYSMFGKVTEGFDTTAKAIAATGTTGEGTPISVTTITRVTISES